MLQRFGAYLLLSALVLGGCSSSTEAQQQLLQTSSPSSSQIPSPSLSPATTADSTMKDVEAQLSELQVQLVFEQVIQAQTVKQISSIPPDTVLKELSISSGKLVFFKKTDDVENVYAAYQSGNSLYDIGAVGGEVYMDDLSVTELSLFNRSLLRTIGSVGANASIYRYFSIADGTIEPFLTVDNGHAREIDVDGDGVMEVISSHGLPMQTFLYKWQDDQFMMANVNEALGAVSVYFDEQANDFKVQYEVGGVEKSFIYKDGVMKQSVR